MAKFGNENYRDYEYTGKEKYTNDIGKNFIEPAANNKNNPSFGDLFGKAVSDAIKWATAKNPNAQATVPKQQVGKALDAANVKSEASKSQMYPVMPSPYGGTVNYGALPSSLLGSEPEEKPEKKENEDLKNQTSYITKNMGGIMGMGTEAMQNPNLWSLDSNGNLDILDMTQGEDGNYYPKDDDANAYLNMKRATAARRDAYDYNGDGTVSSDELDSTIKRMNGLYRNSPYQLENGEGPFKPGEDGGIQSYNFFTGEWQDFDDDLWNRDKMNFNYSLNGADVGNNMPARRMAEYLLFNGYNPYEYMGGTTGSDSWANYQFDWTDLNRHNQWWDKTMAENSAIGDMYKDIRDWDWGPEGYSHDAYLNRVGAQPIDWANMSQEQFRAINGDNPLGMYGVGKYIGDNGYDMGIQPMGLDWANMSDDQRQAILAKNPGVDSLVDNAGILGLSDDAVPYALRSMYTYEGEGWEHNPWDEYKINQVLRLADPNSTYSLREPSYSDWDIEQAYENYVNPYRLYSGDEYDYDNNNIKLDFEQLAKMLTNQGRATGPVGNTHGSLFPDDMSLYYENTR